MVGAHGIAEQRPRRRDQGRIDLSPAEDRDTSDRGPVRPRRCSSRAPSRRSRREGSRQTGRVRPTAPRTSVESPTSRTSHAAGARARRAPARRSPGTARTAPRLSPGRARSADVVPSRVTRGTPPRGAPRGRGKRRRGAAATRSLSARMERRRSARPSRRECPPHPVLPPAHGCRQRAVSHDATPQPYGGGLLDLRPEQPLRHAATIGSIAHLGPPRPGATAPPQCP